MYIFYNVFYIIFHKNERFQYYRLYLKYKIFKMFNYYFNYLFNNLYYFIDRMKQNKLISSKILYVFKETFEEMCYNQNNALNI